MFSSCNTFLCFNIESLTCVELKLSDSKCILEVIIDYESAFVTYGNEIESKGVQFPSRDAPDKINRGG